MSLRLGALIDCEGRLQRDFTDFARLWSTVKEDWRDDRCRRFEQTHLSTLGPSLSRFTTALHEFCDTVRKADSALQDEHDPAQELN